MGSDLHFMMQSPEHNHSMGAYRERKRILGKLQAFLGGLGEPGPSHLQAYAGFLRRLESDLLASVNKDEAAMKQGPL